MTPPSPHGAHEARISLTLDRKYSKSTHVLDFVLDMANAGASVLCSVPTPNRFENDLQNRAVERSVMIWTTPDKYGVRVAKRLPRLPRSYR